MSHMINQGRLCISCFLTFLISQATQHPSHAVSCVSLPYLDNSLWGVHPLPFALEAKWILHRPDSFILVDTTGLPDLPLLFSMPIAHKTHTVRILYLCRTKFPPHPLTLTVYCERRRAVVAQNSTATAN